MKGFAVCVYVLICCFSCSALGVVTPYDGNNMLNVLGQSITSPVFKEFKIYWQLDASFENRNQGIKVSINPLNDKAEGITIVSNNPDLSDNRFKKCTAKLPLDLSLEDDTLKLADKLGKGEKLLGRNTLRYYNGNLSIEATYTNLKNGKITFLKFSTDVSHPLVLGDTTTVTRINRADKRKQFEQEAFFRRNPDNIKAKEPEDTVYISPLQKAIISVFKASKYSSFESIKTEARTESNFWNYHYTYNTKLKIPGEKYNMLYSFPFATSQLDFVVVLKESDNFDKSFNLLYHDFEKQLMAAFPPGRGWTATCLPGKDKSQLPDLEFRNDKYGAVILDHSNNPAGRHILYLRFLLFSD